MSNAMKRVEKIRQIVQLKQVMQRWRGLSLRRGGHRRHWEADEGSSSRPVPPGFLAVYVGEERRRFVIPTRFLNYPVFAALLKQAEEEFGFSAGGGLALPCDVEFFRRVVELLDVDEGRYRVFPVEGFLELHGGAGGDLSCCRVDELGSAADPYNGFSPLLIPKARVL
ncbi:hypothetical protein Taro_047186 [Colocasia esculenta]|uniref:Uncharacterized protein n=1 Tax=Colocasia esculenta TaxID=4460 RepID=A0A843X0H9_COLES|nr:hypothetical protein [Colocasia esculenta]